MLTQTDLNSILKTLGRVIWPTLLRAAGATVVPAEARFEDVTVTQIPEHRSDQVLIFDPPVHPETRGLTLEYTVNPPTRPILVKWSLKRFGLEDLLGHPIALLVVYLWRGDRQTFADRLRTEVTEFEEVFHFPTVKLWECRARIVSGELRELAPLLTLCEDEPTVATLETARALLLDPAIPAEKRPLLIGATMAVGLRDLSLELVQQVF